MQGRLLSSSVEEEDPPQANSNDLRFLKTERKSIKKSVFSFPPLQTLFEGKPQPLSPLCLLKMYLCLNAIC